MSNPYQNPGPTREEVDSTTGTVALEFGTDWCGYCQAAQPHIADALSKLSNITHIKVEDGSGRRLGRSFKVKLWPTLILLKDGAEVGRVVRPRDSDEILKTFNGKA